MAPIEQLTERIEHEAKERDERVQDFLKSAELATATQSFDFGSHDKEFHGYQWCINWEIPRPNHEGEKDLIEAIRAIELFKKYKDFYSNKVSFLCSDQLIALLNKEALKRGELLEIRLIRKD